MFYFCCISKSCSGVTKCWFILATWNETKIWKQCVWKLCCVLALCPVSSLCFCGVTRTGWMWFPCTMNYTVSSFIAPPVTVISTFCWCLAGCNLTFSTPKLKTQAFPGDMRNLFWRQQTIVQFYTEWQWKKVLSFQLYYPRILQCGYIYIISKKYLDF